MARAEVEVYEHLVALIKEATGNKTVVKGYPSWGRMALTPPVISVLLGYSGTENDRGNIGTGRQVAQQYAVVVFGSNEIEKIDLVAAIRNHIRTHQAFTSTDGIRVGIKFHRGEPHVPLTDQQAEQYGYDLYFQIVV